MTLAVKHNFVSAKADGTDPTLLKPSYWNDTHSIQCATNVLLGKASAGTGPVEELPTSAAVIALLASADLPTFLAALGVSNPTTGDGKLTLKTTADTGWVMLNDGTFGNAGSGGTTRANVDCLALFTLIYNNIADADCQVLTSAGVPSTRAAQGSAATAWAALCRMSLPKQLGRAFVAAGSGASLTTRALGSSFGVETVTLGTPNLPPYTPTGTVHSTGTAGNGQAGGFTPGGGTLTLTYFNGSVNGNTYAVAVDGTLSGVAQGGTSVPFGVVQPSTAWNVMVRL